MSLLLDSHIFLGLLEQGSVKLSGDHHAAILLGAPNIYVSIASLWELAIKHRLGQLDIAFRFADLPGKCRKIGLKLLPIKVGHVLAELRHEPSTKDPFDRLLLAQAQVENLRLMTNDRALVAHPLAWTAP